MAQRPFFLLLVSVFSTLALARAASAQSAPAGQTSSPAPVVTVSVTPSGVRFAALGAVRQTRLEVYDASGARLFDSDFLAGNVRDWNPQGLADGRYTCALTARGLDGRLTLRQGAVVVYGGAASLELGGDSGGDAEAGAAAAAGPGAATLSTHDGSDGAVTSTQGALTLRTGDLLAGEDMEHVRVTPEGRVGIGTKEPEATLDVAGDIHAAGAVSARDGIRFADGSTLSASAGRLRLTTAEGDEAPAPSVAGTGTLNRLAKWLETGGAGTLGDSALTEVGGNVGLGTSSPTGKLQLHAAAGQAADLRMTSDAVASPFTFGGAFPPNLGARLTFATVQAGGLAAQGFTDSDAPAFRFQGHIGALAPAQGAVIFEAFKTDGAGGRAPLGAGERAFDFYSGGFDAGGALLLTVRGDGDVGIGTPSPQAKLDVVGAVRFTGLRTEGSAASPRVVGGSSGNIALCADGITIGGGGSASAPNRVIDHFGTIGGGRGNVAGLAGDTCLNLGPTTVGGGENNTASRGHSTVGGGFLNTASGTQSTVGGGTNNVANGGAATIGGGSFNIASGNRSTVPGGSLNSAGGEFSFAAGLRAKANHDGAFVWADATSDDFASTAPNQFLIRAAGGVGIGTNAPAAPLHVFRTTSAVSSPVAVVESGGTQVPLSFHSGGAEAARVRADSLGNLVLATVGGTSKDIFFRAGDDSSTDMFIDSATGNVGVGTTGPNRLLHVNGRARVADIPPEASVGSVCFNAPGDLLQCGASSLRHKRDVTPFTGGLSVVNRLRPIAFTWKRGGARDVGLGAEEVERVAPQFTFANEAGEVEGVKYDRLPILLISAVQEQQRQIAQLRREVAALRRQNARLAGRRAAPRHGRRGAR